MCPTRGERFEGDSRHFVPYCSDFSLSNTHCAVWPRVIPAPRGRSRHREGLALPPRLGFLLCGRSGSSVTRRWGGPFVSGT